MSDAFEKVITVVGACLLVALVSAALMSRPTTSAHADALPVPDVRLDDYDPDLARWRVIAEGGAGLLFYVEAKGRACLAYRETMQCWRAKPEHGPEYGYAVDENGRCIDGYRPTEMGLKPWP